MRIRELDVDAAEREISVSATSCTQHLTEKIGSYLLMSPGYPDIIVERLMVALEWTKLT
jgi:hypothetical protein